MTDRNWESGNTKGSTLEEILAGLCLLGLVVSFIMLVGTAGAVECDNIDVATAVRRGIAWLIIMLFSVSGIVKFNNESEEDIYDRL